MLSQNSSNWCATEWRTARPQALTLAWTETNKPDLSPPARCAPSTPTAQAGRGGQTVSPHTLRPQLRRPSTQQKVTRHPRPIQCSSPTPSWRRPSCTRVAVDAVRERREPLEQLSINLACPDAPAADRARRRTAPGHSLEVTRHYSHPVRRLSTRPRHRRCRASQS